MELYIYRFLYKKGTYNISVSYCEHIIINYPRMNISQVNMPLVRKCLDRNLLQFFWPYQGLEHTTDFLCPVNIIPSSCLMLITLIVSPRAQNHRKCVVQSGTQWGHCYKVLLALLCWNQVDLLLESVLAITVLEHRDRSEENKYRIFKQDNGTHGLRTVSGSGKKFERKKVWITKKVELFSPWTCFLQFFLGS